MPNGKHKKHSPKRRTRSPLLYRRFPWILLGFAICAGLLLLSPHFANSLLSLRDNVGTPPSLHDILVLERNVVDLANDERESRGIPILTWDEELHLIAREHSEAMAEGGRLFHTPVDRPYGENVWGGSTSSSYFNAADIIEGWMTSPKHRTWLLCPHLQHIAVGIAVSDRGIYASWTFWRNETRYKDWWYMQGDEPPDWWH